MKDYFDNILEYIQSLTVIDTHEHLPPNDLEMRPDGNILSVYFTAYLYEDLISAGLPLEDARAMLDPRIPLMDNWKRVEPYWQMIRNTGYAREARLTIKLLYEMDDFHGDTLEELNRRFLEARRPGIYEEILHKRCKIETCLLDSDLNADRRYFRSTVRMDPFIYPRNLDMFHEIERSVGFRISRFDDWLEACERYFENAIQIGAVALKSNLAYERGLHYERSTYSEAEREFKDLLVPLRYPPWDHEYIRTGKKFQDYMMHYILGLAQRRGFPFQIHTGLQAGNGNLMRDADPSLLCNLFLEYPDVKFGVMHIGYPNYQTLAVQAKCFPNVYIDMSWAHIISPNASIAALNEYLDAVPVNKIFAFGGDHHHIDAVVGHLHMMQRNLAKAVAGKMQEHSLNLEEAKFVIKRLLYDNPKQVYQL